MKNQNKSGAPADTKLTPEQQQILELVKNNGYTCDMLCIVFGYIGKTEMEDFVTDMDIHIEDYLASVDLITESELSALCKLYSFNRSLAHISGQL